MTAGYRRSLSWARHATPDMSQRAPHLHNQHRPVLFLCKDLHAGVKDFGTRMFSTRPSDPPPFPCGVVVFRRQVYVGEGSTARFSRDFNTEDIGVGSVAQGDFADYFLTGGCVDIE